MTDKIFIIRVEISANVRQSTQIKFDDLRLPETVIDALQKQQSVSIRPTLSGKLKEHLNSLRIEQRKLYDECTINQGDTHFLHEDYFQDAMERINRIRTQAAKSNQELNELWNEEYAKWANTVSEFLEPLFANDDPESLKMAKEAYLTLFPTKQEFENPIQIFVLGPNPVFLEKSLTKEEHPLADAIHEASVLNTTEVLKAAQQGAADRACLKAAELLDDLDVRIASKVGERQTNKGGKRRGSWQITAENLQLVSSHCVGFEKLSELTRQLTEVGVELQLEDAKAKNQAYKRFTEIKAAIRKELEEIVATRDSSAGLEALKKSLVLSGTYKDLISKIQDASTEDQLDDLHALIQVEKDVYEQRARHLQNLFDQRSELIKSANVNLDDVIAEVKALEINTVNDLDF